MGINQKQIRKLYYATIYQIEIETGSNGLIAFCQELNQFFSYNENYDFPRNGTTILNTGDGGTTRWVIINDTSYLESEIVEHWVDIDRYGFVDQSQTSLSFDSDTYTFTLSGLTEWEYYIAGIKYTISGNKSVALSGSTPPADTYFIYIDSIDGTLISSTTPWTLLDTKVPVTIIKYNSTLSPTYQMQEERHTCLIDRRDHFYNHVTRGTQFVSGGQLTGPTLTTATNAAVCYGISDTLIADEDILDSLSGLTRPDGNTSAYTIFYRTSSTDYSWLSGSTVPFRYTTAGYIQWDNNGTMTQGVASRYYNTYLIYTSIQGQARFINLHGRGQYTSVSNAQAEDIKSFDFSGFGIAESVIAYQFTWGTSNSYTNLGKCRLEIAPKRIGVSTITTVGSAASFLHNTLAGLQGGKPDEFYHLNYNDYIIATGISYSLSIEQSVRSSSDVSLETRISTEESNRSSGDVSLTTRISTEEVARISGDTSLESEIDDLTYDVELDLTSLENVISVEISNRISADESLEDLITNNNYWSGGTNSIYYNGGNVGIGTTDPQYKLDVVGNININSGSSYSQEGLNVINIEEDISGRYNIFVGPDAGTVGSDSQIAIGRFAASNNQGEQVVAIGAQAASNNYGNKLTVIGVGAGTDNIGDYNTLIGNGSGLSNSGSSITSIGAYSSTINTGENLISIGYYSSRHNSGDYVISIGNYSSDYNSGNNVIAIGYGAASGNTLDNQFIVQQKHVNETPLIQGNFNTPELKINGQFYVSGLTNNETSSVVYYDPTTGELKYGGIPSGGESYWNSGSTGIIYYNGGNVGIGTTNPSYKLQVHGTSIFNIGENLIDFAVYSESNNNYMIKANGNDNYLILQDINGEVGIGTTNPNTYKLYVSGNTYIDGSLTIVNGTQGINKVLTSDINGLATWEEIDFSSIESAISTEELDRLSSDTSLESEIDDLTYDIDLALTSLEGAITGETSNRISGDESLTTRISLEESNRSSSDVSLTTRISTEEYVRESGDESLETSISTEIATHTHYQLYQPNGTNPFVYTDNGGTLHIDGNILQSGDTYETHAEQIYTTKNYIILRSGATGGMSTGEYTGFESYLYDGVNNGRLVFDSGGTARVGDVSDEQPLTTRIESPSDNQFAYWENSNKRLNFKQLQIGDINNLQSSLYWNSGSTGIIYYNGGNVGIGTTNPTRIQENVVTSEGTEVIALQLRNNATGTTTAVSLRLTTSTIGTTNSGSEIVTTRTNRDQNGDNNFIIRVSNSTTMNNRFEIRDDGQITFNAYTTAGYLKNNSSGIVSSQSIPIPVTDGGTGTATVFTTGSIIFAGASGVYSQNNSNIFWDNNNNRLGIGTNIPSHGMDVVSNIFRLSSSLTDSTVKYARYTGGHYTTSEEPVMGMFIGSTGTENYVVIGGGSSSTNTATRIGFYLASDTGTTTGTEVGRWTTTGFGIGTSSPTTLLNIYGSNGSPQNIRITMGTGTWDPSQEIGRFSFYTTDGSGVGARELSSIVGINDYSSTGAITPSGALSFYTSEYNSTTLSEKMRITSSGNIGIGTTNPSTYKLYVSGNTYIDGTLTIVDGTQGAGKVLTSDTNGLATWSNNIKLVNDSSSASSANVGTLRYRTSGNNSYVDICMQTGASTYTWVNIVENNW